MQKNQEKQAERMLKNSLKRFPPAAVGDTVMVPIPDVDRGRAEFPNVKAVVIEVMTLNYIFVGKQQQYIVGKRQCYL